MKTNTARNRKLVQLRERDPIKYSYRTLAKLFGITCQTAHEIYQRDQEKYAIKLNRARGE